MKIRTFLIIFFICLPFLSKAQHFALSTNLLEWADLGTVNLNAAVSASRHFSIEAGTRYNPFKFTKQSGLEIMDRETTAYVGAKYWPWYVFSGMWIGCKVQYSDFENTGIWRYAIDEGKGVGGGLSIGYTLMVTPHFNIDFGIGGWGGRLFEHTLYHCLNCMVVRENGPKYFLKLDEISISLMFIL